MTIQEGTDTGYKASNGFIKAGDVIQFKYEGKWNDEYGLVCYCPEQAAFGYMLIMGHVTNVIPLTQWDKEDIRIVWEIKK